MKIKSNIVKLNQEAVEKIRKYFESAEGKALVAKVKELQKQDEGKEYDFEMVITTETRDRHGEIIKQDGLDIENYMKAPVVLYGHFHTIWDLREGTPIVGYTDEIIKDPETKQTIARGRFVPKGFSQIADQVRTLYEAGMPMPASVGIRVFDYDVENETIMRSELVEWSFVEIAANPDAIDAARAAARKGADIKALIESGILSKDFAKIDFGLKFGEPVVNVKNDDTEPAEQEPETEADEQEVQTDTETPEAAEQENQENNAEQDDAQEPQEGEAQDEPTQNDTPADNAQDAEADKSADADSAKADSDAPSLAEQVGARLARMQSEVIDAVTAGTRDVVNMILSEDEQDKALAQIVQAEMQTTLRSVEDAAAVAHKVDRNELSESDLQKLFKAINNGTSAALAQINKKLKQAKQR